MRRLKYLLFTIIMLVFMTVPVSAATCSYDEQAKLNSEVANIKTNYEVKQRVLDKSEYDVPDEILGTELEDSYVLTADYMQINILNLTENVYVEVTNNQNDDIKTFHYEDATNGNISFDQMDVNDLVTYTFKIYSSSKTGCADTLLKTLYLSLPRYNSFSEYTMCQDVPDYYLCKKYVNFEEVEFNDFVKEITKEIERETEKKQEEANAKWYQKVIDFIVENKVAFIVGGGIVVVTAGIVTFVIIRKRRRSVI